MGWRDRGAGPRTAMQSWTRCFSLSLSFPTLEGCGPAHLGGSPWAVLLASLAPAPCSYAQRPPAPGACLPGCCDKSPQTKWLHMAQLLPCGSASQEFKPSLPGLESRCWWGWFLLEAPSWADPFPASSSSKRHPRPSAGGHVPQSLLLHIQCPSPSVHDTHDCIWTLQDQP